jgi:hypothetical protein
MYGAVIFKMELVHAEGITEYTERFACWNPVRPETSLQWQCQHPADVRRQHDYRQGYAAGQQAGSSAPGGHNNEDELAMVRQEARLLQDAYNNLYALPYTLRRTDQLTLLLQSTQSAQSTPRIPAGSRARVSCKDSLIAGPGSDGVTVAALALPLAAPPLLEAINQIGQGRRSTFRRTKACQTRTDTVPMASSHMVRGVSHH